MSGEATYSTDQPHGPEDPRRELAACREALNLGLEAIERHDEWCGNLATAPGNGIWHRFVAAARASLGGMADDGGSEARPNGELGTPRELTAHGPDSLQEAADASDRASLSPLSLRPGVVWINRHICVLMGAWIRRGE